MKRRDPVLLGDLLDTVLARVGAGRAPDLVRLVEEWSELAGPSWAARSRPVKLVGGRLVVETDDGATATLLRYQVVQLVERLADQLGAGAVHEVVIRVARPGGRNR